MKIAAIILAAGESRRMGNDKLRQRYRGEAVLYRAISPYIMYASLQDVLLVVRPDFEWPAHPAACKVVVNDEYGEGMAASIRAGVRAAPADTEAYLIALADMPSLSMSTLDRILETYPDCGKKILQPLHLGQAGHPVIVHKDFREELLTLRGDTGARQLLREREEEVCRLELEDPAVVFDIDRPEDLGKGPDERGLRLELQDGLSARRVLIKGAGEMASGVAHRLFCCGFRVVMTEIERPTAIRRTVAFASAVQEGETTVEGVRAVGYGLDEIDILDSMDGSHIPVFVDPECTLLERWRPDVLIDGRLLKRNEGNRIDDASLVIGLGPGLQAGRDVHVVIETHRGHNLARIIAEGEALADTGVPGDIANRSIERVLRAPDDGIFESKLEIGVVVRAGEVVGRVGESEVRAAIAGVLRGLIYSGYEVEQGQKIGDVDPRGEASYCLTITDKARCISGACLEAILDCSRGT